MRSRATELGLDLDGGRRREPLRRRAARKFAEEYARLRAHKGITVEQARDTVTDVSYFGTMMVHLGLADGMVSGAAHTTAHTIRPGVRDHQDPAGRLGRVERVPHGARRPGARLRRLRRHPRPDRRAARRHRDLVGAAPPQQFGIEPRVAMLSYSTGESGSGADVEKVRDGDRARARAAARPARRGPDPVRRGGRCRRRAPRRCPDSQVAGRATVFIFPDLNTGNNTYKAVQRSAGAVAIGPVLQGLQQADQRPLARRARARHRQHRRDHRDPGSGLSRMSSSPRRQLRLVVVQVPAHRRRDASGCSPRGLVERIGEAQGRAVHTAVAGDGAEEKSELELPIADHTAGFAAMLDALARTGPSLDEHPPIAVGHRVVHGGQRFFEPTVITDLVTHQHRRALRASRRCTTRRTCEGIGAAQTAFPDVPHVAVFDTAFHQTLPPAAYTYAIDAELAGQAPHPPLRLPRHLAQVRVARRPPSSSAAPLGDLKHDRAAPRQRRLGLRGRRRPLGRHVDGHDAARGARDGHALRRHRPRRAASTCTARPGSSIDELDDLLNRSSGLLGLSGTRRHARRASTAAARGRRGRGRSPSTSTCTGSATTSAPTSRSSAASTRSCSPPASARTTPVVRAGALAGLECLGIEIDARPQRGALARRARSSRRTTRPSPCSSSPRTRSSRSPGRPSRSRAPDPLAEGRLSDRPRLPLFAEGRAKRPPEASPTRAAVRRRLRPRTSSGPQRAAMHSTRTIAQEFLCN